jgi:hypothetical protein
MSPGQDGDTWALMFAAGPDGRPGYWPVAVCPDCAALVPVDRADRHARWHRRTDPDMRLDT